MDIRSLRNFLVVADLLHFRAAAEAIGTSQPALSQQIRALERDLGVELFERTKRRVRLSPAGTTYRTEVAHVLERLEAANAQARAAQRGRRGELVIGASSPAALSDLPRIIRAYRVQFPDVALQLRIMRSNDLYEALNARTLHVAFMRKPLRDPGIHSEPIWDHPFRLVLSAAHVAAKQDQVRLADLHGETLISYRRNAIPETYDQVVALCNSLGFEPARIEEVTSIEPAIGLIASGFGVSILPAPWERTIGLPDIAFRQIAAASRWRFRISLCRHHDERSALAQSFIDFVREQTLHSKTNAPI